MSEKLVDVVHEALTARGWSDAEASQIISRIMRHGQQAKRCYPKLPFGKWQGYPINEVPEQYLSWLISQPWFRQSYYALYEDCLEIL